MASLRIPALRHLAVHHRLRIARVSSQRRWAQVHDLRFLTTNPAQPILDKYREKLDRKARQEGHKSIEDLKAAYDDKIRAQRKKDAIETPVLDVLDKPVSRSPPAAASEPRPQAPAAKAPREPSEKPTVKSLADLLDLDKFRALPDQELTTVWRLRYASSPQSLCAVIPAATYRAMAGLAQKTPQFILPVPHVGQGAEIHFLQWTFDAASKTSTVLFTQLAEYKNRGEFSQPHTTITHHLDLIDERGLVLMQGQVMDGRGVQPDQAKWLIMCLQKFYGGWEADQSGVEGQRRERAAERKQLMEWFAQDCRHPPSAQKRTPKPSTNGCVKRTASAPL
ncbi:hypothetical protein S40285_03831 [Stachybotrys chlorohalonatus IBT 40285]|uniref:ATP11 protein n=1 Tax=Stachybotrys chlorohalonatus (strain IBT 40285) TaxID=1283841 RepID=A0A084QFR3_STAC4|nr:hypothetical protein S40285_03831 [Stachybotrys chlorohalonata IBT 40285]